MVVIIESDNESEDHAYFFDRTFLSNNEKQTETETYSEIKMFRSDEILIITNSDNIEDMKHKSYKCGINKVYNIRNTKYNIDYTKDKSSKINKKRYKN